MSRSGHLLLVASYACCIAIAVGAFAPWAVFGPIYFSGQDLDSLVILLGSVLVAVSLIPRGRYLQLRVNFAFFVAVICTLLSVGNLFDIYSESLGRFDLEGFSAGWGVIVTSGSALILAIVCAIQAQRTVERWHRWRVRAVTLLVAAGSMACIWVGLGQQESISEVPSRGSVNEQPF
jgi:hypothetical protein